jgi:hypothetical protein
MKPLNRYIKVAVAAGLNGMRPRTGYAAEYCVPDEGNSLEFRVRIAGGVEDLR